MTTTDTKPVELMPGAFELIKSIGMEETNVPAEAKSTDIQELLRKGVIEYVKPAKKGKNGTRGTVKLIIAPGNIKLSNRKPRIDSGEPKAPKQPGTPKKTTGFTLVFDDLAAFVEAVSDKMDASKEAKEKSLKAAITKLKADMAAETDPFKIGDIAHAIQTKATEAVAIKDSLLKDTLSAWELPAGSSLKPVLDALRKTHK